MNAIFKNLYYCHTHTQKHTKKRYGNSICRHSLYLKNSAQISNFQCVICIANLEQISFLQSSIRLRTTDGCTTNCFLELDTCNMQYNYFCCCYCLFISLIFVFAAVIILSMFNLGTKKNGKKRAVQLFRTAPIDNKLNKSTGFAFEYCDRIMQATPSQACTASVCRICLP